MQQLEKSLQQFAKKLAKTYSILCYKINSENHRGMPDLLLVDQGLVYFIELKSPSGKGRLSPLQELTIQQLVRAGAVVFIISDYELLELTMLAIHAECLTNNLRKIFFKKGLVCSDWLI